MQRKPMPYGYGSMNSHVKKKEKKILKRCSNLRQLAALVMHEYFFSLFFLPSHFYFHPTETSFSDGGDAVRESHTHARQFHSPQMIFLPRFLRKKKISLGKIVFFPCGNPAIESSIENYSLHGGNFHDNNGQLCIVIDYSRIYSVSLVLTVSKGVHIST